MNAIVFAGPSLPPSATPVFPGFEWLPPVRQGDLYKAALRRPALIGIIDGYFEVIPTVWHKEILWAMTQGVHVYGAASIGALRATELAIFGMKGIGDIYEKFRAGVLQDDDEVAVLHGPPELDYMPLTEAMVNVRATLHKALKLGIVDSTQMATLLEAAKSLFYKERTFDAILAKVAVMEPSIPLRSFAIWVEGERVDQKRDDAMAMVHAMRDHLEDRAAPLQPSFEFAHTFAWEEARQRAEQDLAKKTESIASARPFRGHNA